MNDISAVNVFVISLGSIGFFYRHILGFMLTASFFAPYYIVDWSEIFFTCAQ